MVAHVRESHDDMNTGFLVEEKRGAALHWEPSGLCENDAVGIMTTRMRRQLRVEAAAVGEPLHKTAEREISKKKNPTKLGLQHPINDCLMSSWPIKRR